MFACIPVLHHQINDVAILDHKTQWSIRLFDCGVGSETQCTEDSGNLGVVVGDLVEHGMVSSIVHGIEDYFEFDGFSWWWPGYFFNRNQRKVVNIAIFIDEAIIVERVGAGVADRGGDIWMSGCKSGNETGTALTWHEIRRDSVEHVDIHIGMYGPVGSGVITSSDENRITLRHSKTE